MEAVGQRQGGWQVWKRRDSERGQKPLTLLLKAPQPALQYLLLQSLKKLVEKRTDYFYTIIEIKPMTVLRDSSFKMQCQLNLKRAG